MSYDLFFRTDRVAPTADALRAWLAARPYTTVTRGAVVWNDGAIGVSFRFELADDARPGTVPVSFVMDLPRPGIAALVAEVEVQALVAAFGLGVFDPQPEGMADGIYSREGFLRGWRSANAAAHRDLLRGRADLPVPTLPAARNAAVVAWNRAREAYADRLAAVESLPCTVPPVMLLAPRGDERTVLTAVAWSGEPTALPDVDLVLASAPPTVRDTPDPGPARAIPLVALRPWLTAFERRPADHRFGRHGRSHVAGLLHWIADTDARPGDLADDRPGRLGEALRALGTVRPLDPVPRERVLDRETVDAARAVFRTPPGAVPRL